MNEPLSIGRSVGSCKLCSKLNVPRDWSREALFDPHRITTRQTQQDETLYEHLSARSCAGECAS
jgi:hypothetical protein